MCLAYTCYYIQVHPRSRSLTTFCSRDHGRLPLQRHAFRDLACQTSCPIALLLENCSSIFLESLAELVLGDLSVSVDIGFVPLEDVSSCLGIT